MILADVVENCRRLHEGYQGEAGRVLCDTSTTSLPFTGLDLLLVVSGGVLLLALGVAMRRRGT